MITDTITNTQTHARRELQILRQTTPDAIILDFESEILALCEAFGRSGQSGGSAPYTAGAITAALEKLFLFNPIAPITGEDQEWVDVTEINDRKPWFQNSRCGGLFKDGVDAQPYYLDAIVWKGPREHDAFTGSAYDPVGVLIRSSQCIKSFPFTPKTFYVDVIYRSVDKQEAEAKGLHYIEHGDNTCTISVIKDASQLEEVFEYYGKRF